MNFSAARPMLVGFALVLALLPLQDDGLEGLQWLEGEWQRQTRAGTVVERWTLTENGLAGESFALRGEQPTLTETLMLVQMGGSVIYVAWPVENPYPVAFPLVSRENDEFVFENTTHDFPQRIIYSRESGDALTVAIEGPGEGGEAQRVEFHFVRR